jgi:uncharacterized protein YecE (DUF72 family)
MTENLYIGTSGFTAAGWSGTFFPRKVPTRDYLSYYASRFNTVELMSTLYGPPAMSTVNNWYSQTPKDRQDAPEEEDGPKPLLNAIEAQLGNPVV